MAREDGERLILYGRHPVLEALRSGGRRVDEVLVEREATGRGADVVALARQAGVRCSPAPRAALTALAGTPHHQGVVARVTAHPYADLEELLEVPRRRGEPGLLVLLDQVQDPGNLGNLLRTAEALGVHGVAVLRHQAVGLTGHAVKAAAGALEYLPVARVGNLVQALEILQGEGYWVIGASTEPAGLPPPWRLDLRGPIALVLGSEGRGLRPLVARRCDALTRIPLAGQVASLNVGAAGAALLYEVVRQRRQAGEKQKSVDRTHLGE
jgi:23S rRNA (guanosine2251-2'-O)-methyltransferase